MGMEMRMRTRMESSGMIRGFEGGGLVIRDLRVVYEFRIGEFGSCLYRFLTFTAGSLNYSQQQPPTLPLLHIALPTVKC